MCTIFMKTRMNIASSSYLIFFVDEEQNIRRLVTTVDKDFVHVSERKNDDTTMDGEKGILTNDTVYIW